MFVPYAIVASVLVVADAGLGWYAPRHFVPNAILDAARSVDGGTLLAGNSTMAAAGIPEVVAAAAGGDPRAPVRTIAIGATHPPEHLLALRRILAREHPARIVYGWYAGQLLPAPVVVDEFVGNRALAFAWSTPRDLALFFPELPAHGLADATAFAMHQSFALLTYGSLVQGRIETRRTALLGESGPRNAFGRVSDFERLSRTVWLAFDTQTAASGHGARFTWSPFVTAMRDEAHAAGASVVWLAMPVTSAARTLAAARPAFAAMSDSIARDLATGNDRVLDASGLMGDAYFSDGLHLDHDGAVGFSRWLGARLAAMEH